ncbi:MAG: YcfL family protein [Gammaproteobacteria bacterium]|nr:YcfL family protein [Gammaproteobacteria bacterium]
MMNKGWSLSCVGVVLMLAGCATSGIEAIGKPMGDPEFAKHLVIHNESLAGDVTITEMNSRVTGGVLEVDVVLTNLTSSHKNIQYLFSWYDADNFEVEQGSRSWTPVTLNGHASTSMKAVAPNPSVKSYKVNVREL